MILGTAAVVMDEPCFSLKEMLGPAPDSRSVRRWQTIRVIRYGDRLAEFRRDLGEASGFTAGEFIIPGGVIDEATGRIEIEHTVGELIDIADLIRSDKYERPEPPKGIDLVQSYQDGPDKRRRKRRAISQFGPAFKIERN